MFDNENSDGLDELREYLNDPDPLVRQFLIRELSKKAALMNRMHRDHPAAMRIWRLAHSIDKKSIEAEAQAVSDVVDEANKKRLAEIVASPAWLDRTHKNHKKIHAEYMRLFTNQEGQ